MAFASGVRLGSTRPAALGPARPCFSFANPPCCSVSAFNVHFGALNYGSANLPPLYIAPVLVPPPAPRRSMPAAEAAPAFPWAAAYGVADGLDWKAEQGAAFAGGADEDGCGAAAAATAVAAATAAATPSVAAADAAGWAEFCAVVFGESSVDEEQWKQQGAPTFSEPKKAAPKAESEARAATPQSDGPAYRTRSQTLRAAQACAPVAARTRSQTRRGVR
ncbi:hypothetical protein Rsub_08559 [Raphidocelis subcapitata]|uniref:Uncharacterized protein n=1 Tax=Raphidocelis subcapitata TaxID=307507 RepID=A0A2V0P6U4_9CHLO|nr:hypothetical protein Rsub_08559 [Raphidocelis subcapitata]|eukprot:GBF95578.1 hypothetical protein Rsub_08559 [Raphidocelis subcapitata]